MVVFLRQHPFYLAGVTDKSRTAIQNVADKHGVQIHTRPTTDSASDWLNSGKAVPKDYDMKAKTLDSIDELIGGPKNREGVVGYFKPEKPPESIMEKLGPEMRADINKRYTQRLEEFDAGPWWFFSDNTHFILQA